MVADIGAGKAKAIADRHESGSDGPAKEKRIDLANNASGRSYGTRANNASGSKAMKYSKALGYC